MNSGVVVRGGVSRGRRFPAKFLMKSLPATPPVCDPARRAW